MKYLYTTIEKIPTYALNYIEYGDKENLTSEDIKNIDDFFSQFKNGYICEYIDEPFFSHCPVFGLPCEVIDTKIFVL